MTCADDDGLRAGSGPAGPRLSRRGLLRAGAALALAGPLVAACTTPAPPPPPDRLLPLLTAANADAATAKAAAAAFADNAATLGVIATVRQQQAAALRQEVDRATGSTPASAPAGSSPAAAPASEAAVTAQLVQGLVTAQHQAADLVASTPRYRAGLVGSVAAGCASLTEALNSTPITGVAVLSAAPGTDTTTAPGASSAAGTVLDQDAVAALQTALGAEHAAVWMYGTASAFATGSVDAEVLAALTVVQNLRDSTEQRISAGGATPKPAESAYVVPTPVTNQATALATLATAESDATVAWRGVLERTDDQGVRALALAALTDSAIRQTRWRRLAGESPASVALPGQPAA